MRPSVSHIVSLCAVSFAAVCLADEADIRKIEFFESKIRPVLIKHCYKCHAHDAKHVRGGLLLDSSAGVVAGGDSGDVVVAGKPEESLLLSSLRHESFEMPPDRKLPDSVIRDFEIWIRDGAVDPRRNGTTIERTAIDLEEGRKFWCFQPVDQPEIPAANETWPQTSIDRFVAAGHRAEEVTAGADASPEQLVRRLYFGLTGLPPTVTQISKFRRDWNRSPDVAVGSVADELLDSQEFGERWGRHWLDVTRFAESSGGGRSLMFGDAWRFRDYVIRSFNDDKPFNQLIREHIAGDLLPWETDVQHDDQVTGVGYLALGPTNYEQQDKELLRMEVVDEQVDTIGRTFLGMTLGCARCHDHKFDPVPTADYYAMAGIFRSTKTLVPGNVSGYVTTALKSGDIGKQLAEWQTQEGRFQRQIKTLQGQLGGAANAPRKHIAPDSLAGIVVDDVDAEFTGPWVDSTYAAPFVGAGYRHDNAKKTGCHVRFKVQLPENGEYTVRLCHNYQESRCKQLELNVSHAGGLATVHIDQRQAPPDGVFATLGTFAFSAKEPAVVSIDAEQCGPGYIIVDAIQFLPVKADQPKSDEAKQHQLIAELNTLQKQLTKLKKDKPRASIAMGVRDQDEPADWHIHIRGGIRQLGDIVPRGVLTVATPLTDEGHGEPLKIPDDHSGRMELANWIASAKNPLTTRVFVNRVWLHLIGEGLVRTPDNFGTMGQRPTHPKLLDYLASTFVTEDEWSVKKLIRRIVTSRVYRLSSTSNPTLAGKDTENRLLTRGFRRRIEAEPLRDAILQISGELDLSVDGGLTIAKVTAYDNAYDHATHSRGFRSVYMPFFRNSMPELFLVFDVANPNLVTGQRTVSTLPSQALFLLNSPLVLEQSQLAAERFLATATADAISVDQRIDAAYLNVVGRRPTEVERRVVLESLQAGGVDSVDAWTAVFQALFASMDFRYLD